MHLNKRDGERLLEFYRTSLRQFGADDPRSVRWSQKNEQILRFRVLTNVTDLADKSILDVGCGSGDLYKFLLEQKIPVDYTGIDIVPDFVNLAQNRFPEGKFFERDILDMNKQFDIILASGVLSFKVKDNIAYHQKVIRKMYTLAREAVAFNMLDKRVHVDNETFSAYSPKDIAQYCSTFCDYTEVVTDYLPQDFTVYLQRRKT